MKWESFKQMREAREILASRGTADHFEKDLPMGKPLEAQVHSLRSVKQADRLLERLHAEQVAMEAEQARERELSEMYRTYSNVYGAAGSNVRIHITGKP
jgi:hypothetical protein